MSAEWTDFVAFLAALAGLSAVGATIWASHLADEARWKRQREAEEAARRAAE